MFFRRAKLKQPTFEERLEALHRQGFEVERTSGGGVKVSRGGCAATITDRPGQPPHIERAGWMIGGDIAVLVDAGFQKFWRMGDRPEAPALASQLQTLHAFEEDLKQALGLQSLYNTALGTTNDLHLYDRLEREGP